MFGNLNINVSSSGLIRLRFKKVSHFNIFGIVVLLPREINAEFAFIAVVPKGPAIPILNILASRTPRGVAIALEILIHDLPRVEGFLMSSPQIGCLGVIGTSAFAHQVSIELKMRLSRFLNVFL